MSIGRNLIKKIIADQNEYTFPKNYFDRTQSGVIRSLVIDPSIIIISGIRRSGKSTLMRRLQQEQKEKDYYFNFDDDRLVNFTIEDFQILLEVLIELYGLQNTFYFDEIQNISGWERFIRRLHDQGKKIFITGSNAKLLSKELGTHLTGRTIQLEVYPLSFRELVHHDNPKLLEKKSYSTNAIGYFLNQYVKYVTFGGIPEYVKYQKIEYLKNLYEGILYRDIVVRYNITNEKAVKELVLYFASNIGKEFSYNNLCKYLSLGSVNTISNYCTYLENCYLCFFLTRYSHSLKKQIQYNKKCYMIDPAIINVIGFRTSQDEGRLLENIVFLQLKRMEKEIFFHKEIRECNFVIREKNQIVSAIQVCKQLDKQNTRAREIEGLMDAMKSYNLTQGLIITENEEETFDIIEKNEMYTITVIPIWKWLTTPIRASS